MDRTYLFHAVDWTGPEPRLRVSRADASPTAEFLPFVGSFLGFSQPSATKFCLGYFDFADSGSTYWVPCSASAPIERGAQCDTCKLRDPFAALHLIHRGGAIAPTSGLLRYVSQPHWLYIATFGDGASKVGTAADSRKYVRIREQGALLVTFVARARDGRMVRNLEDGVSATGLVTQGRSKGSKLGGIVQPLDTAEIRRRHLDAANAAQRILASWHPDDSAWTLLSEPWACDYLDQIGHGRPLYPLALGDSAHGLDVKAAWGSAIACTVTGEEESGEFALELSPLGGRLVKFGDFRTQLPNIQMSLF